MSLSIDRRKMVAALQRQVMPRLHELGFRGSFPHFHRDGDRRNDLLGFEFDRPGGGFRAAAAVAPPGDFTAPWGEVIPAKGMKVSHIAPRLRLCLARPGDDPWFRYVRQGLFKRLPNLEKIALEVQGRIDFEAVPWWEATRPDPDALAPTGENPGQAFEATLAEYVLDLLPAERLPLVALQALEAGRDSGALRLLAGETARTDPRDLRELFDRALNEMGIDGPSRGEAVGLAVRRLAGHVVGGWKSPEDGARRIVDIYRCFEDDTADASHEIYRRLEGLYYSYDDFGRDDDAAEAAIDEEIRAACRRIAEAPRPTSPGEDPHR